MLGRAPPRNLTGAHCFTAAAVEHHKTAISFIAAKGWRKLCRQGKKQRRTETLQTEYTESSQQLGLWGNMVGRLDTEQYCMQRQTFRMATMWAASDTTGRTYVAIQQLRTLGCLHVLCRAGRQVLQQQLLHAAAQGSGSRPLAT